MSFKEGDFVKVDYSAWRASDNSLVFTTDQKKAQENKIYDEHTKYEPVLVVVGKNTIVKGIDKLISGMNVNESKKIEIESKDAFGERNPDLVRVMPIGEFRKKDIEPRPGMQLDIDGAVAMVKSVNSGRVVVDANHPLAGEKLLYEVKVVEKVDDDKEKVRALAEKNGLAATHIKLMDGVVELSFGDAVEKDVDYFMNKASFTRSLFRYLPQLTKLIVSEEYTKESVEKQNKQQVN
jgi:FKBP-type peptidyl-prolyl cis-trans isomerase 2